LGGIRLGGDHQTFGNHPGARNVHDIDSIQMIQRVRAVRDEREFQCDDEIKTDEPRMFVGAAGNPFGDPLEFRVRRLTKKVAAGAEFIQTQCIFDLKRFEEFMKMIATRASTRRSTSWRESPRPRATRP
jgi:methylenetetrahydrofolate reductase (NADPH)